MAIKGAASVARVGGLLRYARLTRRQLIVFALASAMLNGIVTASVGAWLAQTYSSHETRRQSIETISNLLYARRTRAGMVASSIRRGADIEEVRERKRAYDEAFAAWNTQIRRNLFVIRDVMGSGGQAKIEQDFEDTLIAAMADVDRCLTAAYDKQIASRDGAPVLAACNMPLLHQFVLDCGSSFMNEMDKLSRLSFLPFSSAKSQEKAIAEARIRKACVRPAPEPPAGPPAEPAPPVVQAPPAATPAAAPAPSPAAP